ncbi:MAG: alpha/beta fold hydrolase, partial [Deltaproteobacteria bacterium]|nr:alpha/beta fold hydrolase [Deltaproteobacteria bacterium]
RDQVLREIMRRMDSNGRPIAIIGHSRGGLMGWALASQLQERVSHLVLLGAPVAAFRESVTSGNSLASAGAVGRMLMRMSDELRDMLDPGCKYPSCGCALVDDIMSPLSSSTLLLSIRGSDDLVVGKAAQDSSDGETLQAKASHLGLVYNPRVYHALGRFLAGRSLSTALPVQRN